MSRVSNWSPHDTVNPRVVSYVGSGSVWENGAIVSTIVQVSFPAGATSTLPARWSAVVANSYTPSAEAVKVNWPRFPAGCVAYADHPPPPVRTHNVMFPRPVPLPSEAV